MENLEKLENSLSLKNLVVDWKVQKFLGSSENLKNLMNSKNSRKLENFNKFLSLIN